MADYDRILLTGGTGFVGPYVARAVAGAYPAARRVALVRPGEIDGNPGWTPVSADLVDEAGIDRAVAECRPDLVVHLAAQASVAHSIGAAETTWRVNFHGTFNLAAALARHAPHTTMLFVSSADVYGLRLQDGPADEATPVCPLTAYAKSKAAAEGMLADIFPETARLVVVRPFNHTGPGQDRRFVLPSFAAQIAAIEAGRRPPRVEVGDLSIERDFLDVRDVADAYMRIIEAGPRLETRCVFNVASGAPRSLASLLDALRQRATKPFEIVLDQHRMRPSDIPVAAGDATKLREATGWRPRYSIEDTLTALLDHWRDIERASPRAAVS